MDQQLTDSVACESKTWSFGHVLRLQKDTVEKDVITGFTELSRGIVRPGYAQLVVHVHVGTGQE